VQGHAAACAERRAWVRHPGQPNKACEFIEPSAGHGWWAAVHEVSLGGISFCLPCRLPPGTVVVIDQPAGPSRRRHAISVRVVHATTHAGGWLLGCAFDQPLREADLQALLQPAEAGTRTRFLSFGAPAAAGYESQAAKETERQATQDEKSRLRELKRAQSRCRRADGLALSVARLSRDLPPNLQNFLLARLSRLAPQFADQLRPHLVRQ
jgi:hypothetical protein